MRANYFYRILFVTLCLVICFSSAAYASDRVKWYSYEEGKALAKIERKKVVFNKSTGHIKGSMDLQTIYTTFKS